MYIYGRKSEKELLEECLQSSFPEFLAVYGRRRIGKTYLIREYFNNEFAFYATGLARANKTRQLKEFYRSLMEYGNCELAVPQNWFDAFAGLKQILRENSAKREYGSGKLVVFLDEAPWMDTQKSDFKSALEWFWNGFGSARSDILFIICGSATSWMIDNVLHDTGGLYNRVTRRIHLKPFTLRESEEFLREQGFVMTRRQIVESYMVFGGVPYYLRLLSQRYSIHQDLERLIFASGGQLREEHQYLYSSLFRNSENYVNVLRALSTRNIGMDRDELAKKTGIKSGGQLTKILNELEACDFIRSYQNYTRNSTGIIYQLMDAYTLFYFHFVETGKISSWLEYLHSPGYYAWSGMAFERVCLMHVSQIKEALKVAGVGSSEYAWKSRASKPGAQIDLLIDRRDDIIDLCEVKYTEEPFTVSESYRNELIRKRESFREESGTNKALHIVMISANGFSGKQPDETIQYKLTQDDLF